MKLSVCMITYNHEKFVRQAVESVMAQKVDFDFELVVGEDCSSDRTRVILEDLQHSHPNRIRLLPSARNMGMNQNFIRVLECCRGEYIALLEGDDYWIDATKLQKQVDYLDQHPGCAVSFHEVAVVSEETGEKSRYNDLEEDAEFTIRDLARRNLIFTSSCLFRSSKRGLPVWLGSMEAPDWGLNVFNAQFGGIHYMSRCMSVYRRHAAGTWSTLSNDEMVLKGVRVMWQLDRLLGYVYHDEFAAGVLARLRGLHSPWTRLRTALLNCLCNLVAVCRKKSQGYHFLCLVW